MIHDDAQQGQYKSSPSHGRLINDAHVPHDIFLSHSGAQKGFAKNLYQKLAGSTFSTFFDIEHHSLRLGEHFPSRIFQAAKSCRVALVVLSEEFVCSKWPMIELCTFVDAMAGNSGRLRLLPLFFKLSPADLKCEGNLTRWRESWTALQVQDDNHPINVSKWEEAVKKLRSQNGIIFEEGPEGELTYIDKVVSAISKIVPPAITFDTTFIVGKDRLCQVILDKLKSMDDQSSRLTIFESASASTSSHSNMVTSCVVLGLYGLPGSGKSTLCRCLVDHFRRNGSTETLYLEFPSSPSNAEVVNTLMKLRHLTDFNDRVPLDRASQLENVESLLKSCRLSHCKVFLVLDNIVSDRTQKAVQRILHLGFGHGSKIILVAHTLTALRKTLHPLKHDLPHWACDSMAIPGIDKKEASEILLRAARGSYGAASEKHTVLKSLTSRQMGIVERIVDMCSSHDSEHGRVWLPLVMNAVGARLLDYENNDLEGWESDQEIFWMRVKTYEQDAVIEELLGGNFGALPNERLQVVFLDVALFILHFERNIDAVSDVLSMMHGICTFKMRMLVQQLERRGFLTIVSDIVGVHDVYLKFARSIQDGPSKYISSSRISWCWKECQIADTEGLVGGNSLVLKGLEDKGKLRALVLEVGESCERVDLQGFSGLTAVLLRNCKSVAVLGLAGLGSLTILEVRNCPSFNGRLECSDSDYTSLLNIKRFSVIIKAESKALAEVDEERGGRQVSSFLQSLVNAVKRWMAPFGQQPHSLGEGFDVASRMQSLQVVHLENTGIGRLECVGGMWPQLRHLTVIEQHLQRLELGHLPQLQQFLFRDVGELWHRMVNSGWGNSRLVLNRWGDSRFKIWGELKHTSEIWRRKEGDARYLLAGQGLMRDCPQLKRVTMQSSFFRHGRLGSLPAGVESLELHYLYTATELPDLSSSAHTLKNLDVLWCEKLERVNLDTEPFKSLTTLSVRLCHNIVEVSGLGPLPSLRLLEVTRCRKLRILKGFENSEMLEQLILVELSELREISCFSSLRKSLHRLTLVGCPKLAIADLLCDMEKLTECDVGIVGECRFNLSNCKSLRLVDVFLHNVSNQGSLAAGARLLIELEGLGLGHIKLEKSMTVRIFNVEPLEPILEEDQADSNDRSRQYFDERDDANNNIAEAEFGLGSIVRLDKGSVSFDLSLIAALKSNPLREHSRPTVQLGIRPRGVCMITVERCHVLYSMDGIGQSLATLDYGLYFFLSVLDNLRSLGGVESLTQLRRLEVCDCPALEEVPSLRALVHLISLSIVNCPKVEEVPSLRALVHLEYLAIRNCPKVKAVEGCDQMTRLLEASFSGCESMESLPVLNLSKVTSLHFANCKFARDVERMAAWVKDESLPIVLRAAALRAVQNQYSQYAPPFSNEEERLVAQWWVPSENNGWVDYSWLRVGISNYMELHRGPL